MFNVGSQEMLIILVLVFLLFGPKHIPEVAQTLGRGLGELRRTLYGVEETMKRAATDIPEPKKEDEESREIAKGGATSPGKAAGEVAAGPDAGGERSGGPEAG